MTMALPRRRGRSLRILDLRRGRLRAALDRLLVCDQPDRRFDDRECRSLSGRARPCGQLYREGHARFPARPRSRLRAGIVRRCFGRSFGGHEPASGPPLRFTGRAASRQISPGRSFSMRRVSTCRSRRRGRRRRQCRRRSQRTAARVGRCRGSHVNRDGESDRLPFVSLTAKTGEPRGEPGGR